MLTVLIKILCILLIVVERAETKNQTNISSSYSAFAEVLSVYLRVLHWDHFFLIFTSVTFFQKIVTLILLNMLMTIHRIPFHQTLILSFFKLHKNTKRIFRWFYNNLISNVEKSHLIVSTKENLEIQVSIRNEDTGKLLEVHINNNLNFD